MNYRASSDLILAIALLATVLVALAFDHSHQKPMTVTSFGTELAVR